MLERGSPRAALIGRWGMALTLVTGAVLIGRLIRNFPYLLPNRLPGLVLYELGPALILVAAVGSAVVFTKEDGRSEEHTSELQSLMRISYAVFCLKKKMTH